MLFAGKQKFATLFCVGFLTGILVMNLGKSILLEETGLFDEYTLYHMKYMTVDSSALFCYVFRKRIGAVLILAVLATTYLGFAAAAGAALWYGISAGAFLASLTLRYGIKGILLALISVLPHYLLYIPAMLILLLWCEELFRGIYSRGGGGFSAGDKGFLMKKAGQLVLIMLATTVGCLLEGYINPFLLLGYLKIF